MFKQSIMALALVTAFSTSASAAAVDVMNAGAGGYGLDLDLNAQVSATVQLPLIGSSVVGSALVQVETPTPLGNIAISSTGANVPTQSNATVGLNVSTSGSGTGVLALLNPILSLLSPTQAGVAVFSGTGTYFETVTGQATAIGSGSVADANLSINQLLGISADLIQSTSSVTVNQNTGLFNTSADSVLTGVGVTILGNSINLAAAATGGVFLNLGPLGNVSVFANERQYLADGVMATSCAAATFSCAVQTNAIRIALDSIGISSLGLLGVANLSATTDLNLVLGHSYASLVVTPVPEASTSIMMLLGLGALIGFARRRNLNH